MFIHIHSFFHSFIHSFIHSFCVVVSDALRLNRSVDIHKNICGNLRTVHYILVHTYIHTYPTYIHTYIHAGFGIYEMICHNMVITAIMTRSRSQLLI